MPRERNAVTLVVHDGLTQKVACQISVSCAANVVDIKTLISNSLRLPPQQIARLLLTGRPLLDNETLRARLLRDKNEDEKIEVNLLRPEAAKAADGGGAKKAKKSKDEAPGLAANAVVPVEPQAAGPAGPGKEKKKDKKKKDKKTKKTKKKNKDKDKKKGKKDKKKGKKKKKASSSSSSSSSSSRSSMGMGAALAAATAAALPAGPASPQSDDLEPIASDEIHAEPVDIFNTIDGADSALIRSEMAPLEGSQRQSAMSVAKGLRREPTEEEIASVLGTSGADNNNDQGGVAEAPAGEEHSGSNVGSAASKAPAVRRYVAVKSMAVPPQKQKVVLKARDAASGARDAGGHDVMAYAKQLGIKFGKIDVGDL